MRQRPQPDIAEGECERTSGVTAKIGHACLGSAFDCCRPLEGRHIGLQRRERKNGPRHRAKKRLVALRAGTTSNCVRSVSSPARCARAISMYVRDHATWPARFARAPSRLLSFLAVQPAGDASRCSIPSTRCGGADLPIRSAGHCRGRTGRAPVHHGLPERLVPKPVKPSYFAFLGRIAPENGIDRDIRRRRITCRYTEVDYAPTALTHRKILPPAASPASATTAPSGRPARSRPSRRRPSRSRIERDERSETGLHVGDEEDEPIESAQAARRRMQRRLASFECRWRRQGVAGARVELIHSVANGA
jgi:hypothetical protein